MTFTDLPLAIPPSQTLGRFGTIDPRVASSAIGDKVLAFLDVYTEGSSRDRITDMPAIHPSLVRHIRDAIADRDAIARRDVALPCVVPCR